MSYNSVVTADSPLAYFRLADTGSTLLDETGTFNGSISTVPAPSKSQPSVVPTEADTSFEFNNDLAYALAANTGALASLYEGDYTIECWIKIAAAPPGAGPATPTNRYALVTKKGYHLGLSVTYGGTLAFDRWGTGDLLSSAISSGQVPLDTPVHCVATCDRVNGIVKVFMQGVEAGSDTFTTNLAPQTNTEPWSIGCGRPGDALLDYSWPMDGQIDEVAFYDRVLSDVEIAEHYTAGTVFGVDPADSAHAVSSPETSVTGPLTVLADDATHSLVAPAASVTSASASTSLGGGSYGENSYGESSYGELLSEGGPAAEFAVESILFSDALLIGSEYINLIVENIAVTSLYSLSDYWQFLAEETLTIGAAQTYADAFAAKATVVFSSASESAVYVNAVVEQTLTLDSIGAILYDVTHNETVTLTSSIALEHAVIAAERILLEGSVETRLEAFAQVAQAITLLGEGALIQGENFEETISLTEAVLARLIAYDLISDSVVLTDSIEQTLTVIVNTDETVEFTEDTDYSQYLVNLIEEGIELETRFRLGNDVFAAWVVNPATIGASRYDNFPFNSMALAYNTYYAAADDGIYLMEGGDDAGASIAASVKLGLSNFGERRHKRINDVFLGVHTSGRLVLKVTADESGARTEYWYNVVQHGDDDNHRVKCGKGLKGAYFAFELVNVDGADFDLDNLQLYPLTLSRRV
jgi:hypothetical protein